MFESAILENRLIYDYSKIKCEEIVYNLTDLKACYNRQLLDIISIVEELTGIERELVKLFAKVLLRMKHFISIRFGISNIFYRGSNN